MTRSHRYPRIDSLAMAALASLWPCDQAFARSPERPAIAAEDAGDVYLVGSAEETRKTTQSDTVWIADWSFDAVGGGCTDTGWARYDNRIENDGSNRWVVDNRFDGTGGITGQAALLSQHDLLWPRDGYGNDWDYSIVLEYQGVSTLTFDVLSDTELGFDFVRVEADSAGASRSLVDYAVDPLAHPSDFRLVLLSTDGPQNTTLGPIVLPDFGVPATTHEAYIRLVSDGGYSDEDGLYPSLWNAGLVVDNIAVAGGLTYTEDFEAALGTHLVLRNTAVESPFGEWARVYPHITDNDACTENTTCAWLFTDPTLPALNPDMAFGPGGAVVRNWLDDIIVSPWVSLASTPIATGSVLSYRRFSGNALAAGRIVHKWSVRSKLRVDNTDTPAPGDSIVVIGPWASDHNSNTLSVFSWTTLVRDMSAKVPPEALEIQIRLRLVDYQVLNGVPFPDPTPNPGPGPYVDRVRIGRRILSGPVISEGIDSRTQAQDAFATGQNSITPGEHFSPSVDRFGTAAFSSGSDLGYATSPNLITGDSITITATDARGAGGVTAVRFHGAIVAGPHATKAPAPYTVGSGGFFEVVPDTARLASGAVVSGAWFVDLDDTFFRGGDRLLYFWSATDASGGYSTDPSGMTAPPGSVADAEVQTSGLLEVSFLPSIQWDPAYLARIAADAHGDLDPTPVELAGSAPATCILYVQQHATRRRSGDANRTTFMYTLDRLGYRGHYDIYDVQGYGSTNNQLGGRATVAQCAAYALVVQDNGRGLAPNLPAGMNTFSEKVDQTQWYRDYLAQGATGEAGLATLWLLGEDAAYEKYSDPLVSTDFGLSQVVDNQGNALTPSVIGQGPFEFSNGNVGSFSGDVFALNGACALPGLSGAVAHADYDGAQANGTAVVTHRYASGATTGLGAIVMNKDAGLGWNTIWMGFGWFDVHDAIGGDAAGDSPATMVAREILDAVLPQSCQQGEDPTDTGEPPFVDELPRVTALHPNVPNPFNPTTTIRFDLATDGPAVLRVYDVSGRLVRTLSNGARSRGRHALAWNGLDDHGAPIASGVYFCRLEASDAVIVRKLLVVR